MYVNEKGKLNLVRNIIYNWKNIVKPDLGPKFYFAFGMPKDYKGDRGTTNLHLDICKRV